MKQLNFSLRLNKYDNWANQLQSNKKYQYWQSSYCLRGKYSRISFNNNKN